MKRLFYPPPVREFIVVIALLLLGNQLVLGEGSKAFLDYEGFRLFYSTAPVGMVDGFNQVYRPDGSLEATSLTFFTPVKSDFLDKVDLLDQTPTTFSVDTDGDGIDDEEDLDDDNDGIPDVVEQAAAGSNGDTDGDGIPNTLDLDSDNDGISDLIEAGHGQADVNGDGRIDGDNFGANGLHNSLENSDALSASVNYSASDPDRDGVPDYLDLDSDNDGFSDVDEANLGGFDSDNDGRIDNGMGNIPSIDANGLALVISPTRDVNASIPSPNDADGDGIPNFRDLDSDNDGLLDVVEANLGGSDGNNDGRIDDGFGNTPVVDANGLTIVISPTRGVGESIPAPVDSDGDGVPNWRDLDSDNDGIHDVRENQNFDPDNDGIIGGGTPNINANGIVVTDGNGTSILYNPNLVDIDREDGPDYIDLDSDGDQIPDVQEAGVLDGDNDGILGSGIPVININGVPSFTDNNGNFYTSISNPRDSDGDGVADFEQVGGGSTGTGIGGGGGFCNGNNTPVLAASSGGGVFCTGSSTVVSIAGVSNNITGPVDFTWTGPGGFTQTGRVDNANSTYSIDLPNLTPANSGPYTLSITTDEGCTSSPVSVSVNVQGPLSVGISGPRSICGGENLELSATNLGAGTSYEWFRDGVSLGTSGSPTLNAGATEGSYTVRVIKDNNPCGTTAESAPFQVTIGMTPGAVSISGPGESICAGQNLRISTTDLGAGVTYNWFRNGEPIGATSDPSLNVSAGDGVYTVAATQGGCQGPVSSAYQPTIAPAPSVEIGAPAGGLCSGGDLQLTATNLGGGATYNWYRDGQFVATTDVPSYTVTNATSGNYAVAATQNGCIGGLSSAAAVTVGQGPNAAIAGVGQVCAGQDVTVTASDLGAGATYQWFKDGVSLGTTSEPRFPLGAATEALAGGYSLIASRNGCPGESSAVAALSIIAAPSAGSITTANANVCPGETITLTSTDLGAGVNYNWYRDGVSLGATGDPTYAVGAAASSGGTYTMIPSIGSCEGPSSNAVTIAVGEAVETPVLSADAAICSGSALVLTASGVGGTPNYEWFRDGVSLGSTGEPTFSVPEPTSGSYTVGVSGGPCGDGTSNAVAVTVSDVPAAGVLTTSANVCEGETVSISSTDLGEGVSYNWYLGGQLVGTTGEPTYEVAADAATAGEYTMIPSVGSCEGPVSNASQVAIAQPIGTPILAIDNIGTDGSICQGEGVNLSASAVEGATSYEWFRDGVSIGTSDDIGFNINDAIAGSYTVASIGGCGGGTSDPVALAINELPDVTPAISPIPNLECGVSSTDIQADLPIGVEGFWSSSDPNVTFSNASSPNTTVSGLGTSSNVTWTLRDPVCDVDLGSTSSTINVNAISSVGADIPDVITPNNDGFNDALRIPDADCVNVGFKVFNRWGDLVYETDRYNNNDAWEGTHDGDPLPPGPYYYLLTEPGSDEKRSGCVSIYR